MPNEVRENSVPAKPKPEARFDFASSRLPKAKMTPQGFARFDARVTRIGILNYTRPDGSTVRELRHPDEVFKADSLATLATAPITIDHHGLITPDNVEQHQVGVASERVTHDEKFVNTGLTVQRRDALEKVAKRELVEISPGYTCVVDPTPGIWNGERYDQSQTRIKYNHIALGPAGWGRSGPEVALRLDAAVSMIDDAPETDAGEENNMKKIQIRVDGVTYEIEVAESLAPTLLAGLEKDTQERADAKDAIAKAEGAKAAAEKSLSELQERFDAATAPAAVEARVKELTETLEKAKQLAPEEKFDGLSVGEIRQRALIAQGFKSDDLAGKGDAYIEGAFAAAKATQAQNAGGFPRVNEKTAERQDAKEPEFDAEAARKRMIERGQNAYKGEQK